jgi:hypothetical protein
VNTLYAYNQFSIPIHILLDRWRWGPVVVTFDCAFSPEGRHYGGGAGGEIPLLEYDISQRQIHCSNSLNRIARPYFRSVGINLSAFVLEAMKLMHVK